MNRTLFAVHLLGGFELCRDGAPVDVPWSSQRLLGFLALQDRGLARGYVAAALWPDTTDEKAAANLRTALWRLHRPELDLIAAVNGQLAIRPDVWVDVRAVRAAARDQRQSGALPSDDLAIELRGELLPGCWDGWLVFERERLRQEVVHLCEASCASSLAGGDSNRAILQALAAVECDPLRESANVWLLRSHLAAGNRTDAMRHARRYAALLDQELGIEPPAIVDELLWTRPLAPVASLLA
jgi:DNA-binding SARP family transcriptional activator